ncbi:MAG: swr1 complex component [Pleopsidium flavum]|nr:MAG: swr1 complex component [Pleopsidium flavum]
MISQSTAWVLAKETVTPSLLSIRGALKTSSRDWPNAKLPFDVTIKRFERDFAEILGVTLIEEIDLVTLTREMQNGSLNGFSELHHDNQNAPKGEQATSTLLHQVPPNLPVGKVNETLANTQQDLCEDVDNDGPPVKKRKITEVAPRPRSASRPTSPPWKKVTVEGPTSFLEGGKRKSARTNMVPLELQPQAEKRQTRAAMHKTYLTKGKYAGTTSHKPSSLTSTPSQLHSHDKRPVSAGSSTIHVAGKSPAKSGQLNATPAKKSTAKTTPTKARVTSDAVFQTPTNKSSSQKPRSTDPHQTRRSARAAEATKAKKATHDTETNGWPDSEDDEPVQFSPNFKPQRLKFKVRMPTVTIQHPGHVLPQRKFSSFRDWIGHDVSLAVEDGVTLTEEAARREAELRQRIVDAARPGGVLSEHKCSIYVPDPQEEPPQQYAHQDHLVAHVLYFRKLLKQEQRHHLASAKRLAHAAATEWKRRQPKTEEEVIQEYREASLTRYKQLRKDLQQKWEIVTLEVNKRRMVRWEEEQQVLGKQALNRVLEQSTQLLDKRRLKGSSDLNSDEEEDVSDENGSDSEAVSRAGSEDESNMSTSQSESEEGAQIIAFEDDDEGLTIAELRQKYSSLPAKPPNGEMPYVTSFDKNRNDSAALYSSGNRAVELPEIPPGEVSDETTAEVDVTLDDVDDTLIDDSDESTDMDDDLGDSDNDMGSGQDHETEEEGGEENLGLLGFFSKTDLQAQKEVSVAKGEVDNHGDDEMEEEEVEEVSLIPDASQVQTPSASNLDEPFTRGNRCLKIDTNAESRTPATPPEASGDPSSQASPGTIATTKHSEADSVSSVEPLPNHQLQSSSATPQPLITLKTPIPFLLRGTLREYQHYGLDWLAGLYANHTNGILADEMGLGKTIQTIALLAHLAVEHEVWGPHLIVVPTSVMLNWEMEFKKFLPGFKILTYYGSQEERKQKRKGWLDDNLWHVCITSYQLVLQDQQTFKRRNWHYMVLDEAHNIKNFRSQRWQTLLTFKTRARLLLTGTPLQNNLTELWSLLFFLMPSESTETGIGGFADLKEFSDWFRRPVEQILEHGRDTMDDEAKQIVSKLHKVLRPYLLRRLKADVEKQMPAKFEHVVYCRLSKRQRYLYDGFISLAQTRETLASGNYLSIINCLMQLRKVCNHPDLFETRQIVTSFAMPKSAIADFEIKEFIVRRRLLRDDPINRVDLDFLNLTPASSEDLSALDIMETSRLNAIRPLQDLCKQQINRTDWTMKYDGSSVRSALANMENTAKISRMEELRHCVYLNAFRSQKRPIYGSGLVKRLTLDLKGIPLPPRPKRLAELADWFSNSSPAMQELVPTLLQRSEALESTIQKFACITPAVVATDMAQMTLSRKGVEVVQEAQQTYKADAFHEARTRLSIAFPDKRLLQYDCGKLQRLDKLLRDLQAGGHRALIFTQMTKVLDILEQFLNIHGHRYLRLDGATKVEQRQILTDRFNNDTRVLAFILSSRSGGLGINLTGADTVIFYDLDWNPAMDKQCQDRCHRIGQTRDVHIYRFVSEYTIEANILRKANQKRMLDDVVIQEGEFTTDYFNKMSVRDMLDDEALDGDAEASAAMDRMLGGGGGGVGRVLEQVEDREDIAAAKIAEKEMVHTDDADFDEKAVISSGGGATPKTPGPPTPRELMAPPSAFVQTPTPFQPSGGGYHDTFATLDAAESGLVTPDEAFDSTMVGQDDEPGHVDEYMLRFMEWELHDVPIAPPIDKSKKKSKKGQDHRVRRQR